MKTHSSSCVTVVSENETKWQDQYQGCPLSGIKAGKMAFSSPHTLHEHLSCNGPIL